MNRIIGKRSSVVTGHAGPEVHIRAPRQWWPMIFLPVWFTGWTFGGIMAIRQMFIEPQPFLAVWLVGWLAGELFAALTWSWMAFGEEVIAVAQGSLTIAQRIGPLEIKRQYSVHECSALRAAGWFGSPMSFSYSFRPWGLSGGTIAIDYRGRTVRFGIGLDEAEAKAVVKELKPFVRERPATE